jgi:hypothetical protein
MSFRSIGVAVVALLIIASACADVSESRQPLDGSGTPADAIATSLELTCRTDGSMKVSATTVQAQADGVHLLVVNEYDEPVSIGGFDADPGHSTWTMPFAPGVESFSCWPFSQHGSGDEPSGKDVEIVDPDGIYVDGKVECDGQMWSRIADFAEVPDDDGPPPLDVARTRIEGLRDTDVLRVQGYPEQDGAGVIVVRDGRVIASFSFVKFSDRPWTIAGGTGCADSGLEAA